MSRKERQYVWYQYFHMLKEALCPVCEDRLMYKDDSDSWHREHILKLSLGGLDIYPNLIPICRDCNLGAGKRCCSTFHYMYMIGKITEKRALELQNEHLNKCNKFDPVCNQQLKNGNRCANLKGGKDEIYCWKHIYEELEPMDCSD